MSTTASANALRAGSRVLEALSRTAVAQRRCLSLSQSRQAANTVTFEKSSTPELTAVLKEIREKLVLPMYLPEDQRKKIYRVKYREALEREPVTLEIDGEEFQFRYRSLITDMPNTNKLVSDAIRMMKTPGDFQNLPRLLEGVCVHARRRIKPQYYPMLVRKAAKAGCLGVVLDAVKAVGKTGLRLDNHEMVSELLCWIQNEAIDSGWDRKKTEKALRRTELVLDQLEENKEHRYRKVADKPVTPLAFPFYRDPQFLAARLHMAAALAVKHFDGKDVGGAVAKHAQQLVQLWPEGAGLLDLQPDEAYKLKDHARGLRYLLTRSTYVWAAAPVLSALRLAAQVVEPKLAAQLNKRADAVEKEMEVALPSAEGRRGMDVYKKLFGKQEEQEAKEVAA